MNTNIYICIEQFDKRKKIIKMSCPKRITNLPCGGIKDVRNPFIPTPGEELLVQNPGDQIIYIRSLLPGTGVTLNQVGESIQIDAVSPSGDNIYNTSNSLTGNRLLTQGSFNLEFTRNPSTNLIFNNPGNNSIVLDDNITMTTSGVNDITLQSSNDLILEANNTLQFQSLDLATNTNMLYIDPVTYVVTHSTIPPTNVTKTNSGGGTSLFQNTTTNSDVNLKTILAGAGISFSLTANTIEFRSNVTKTNNGSGATLFASTVVNNFISLKSLVAGTNVSIGTSGTEITINANNIYNLNGSISSNRTVTMNNNLTFSGSGNFNVTTNQINLTSATITMPTLPSATQANILYYNTVGGGLSYGLAPGGGGSVESIFKVKLTDSYVIPYSGGVIYDTIPADLPGSTISTDGTSRTWNNSGGNLNLATGVYTAPASFYAIMSINAQINTTVVTNLYFRFRRTSGGALNLAESTFLLQSAPATNQYINFRETVYLESGATYVYQLANTDSVGTVAATTLHLTLDRLT